MSVDRDVHDWSTSDVCSWLSSSGHTDLGDDFKRLNVTGRVLLLVTDDYLRLNIGVSDAQKRQALLDSVSTLQRPAVSGRSCPPHAPMRRAQTLPAGLLIEDQSTLERPPSNLGSEPMLGISAQELMIDGCSNCGWIRKQGGNIRNWKRRYMILKKGCMYYFRDDLAATAKGQFSLNNYMVERATEITRFPWCIRLRHSSPRKRTYLISASSEKEMQEWMSKIESDIEYFCQGMIASPSVSPQSEAAAFPSRAAGANTMLSGHATSKSMHLPLLHEGSITDDNSSDSESEGIYEPAVSDATPFDVNSGPPPPAPDRHASVRRPLQGKPDEKRPPVLPLHLKQSKTSPLPGRAPNAGRSHKTPPPLPGEQPAPSKPALPTKEFKQTCQDSGDEANGKSYLELIEGNNGVTPVPSLPPISSSRSSQPNLPKGGAAYINLTTHNQSLQEGSKPKPRPRKKGPTARLAAENDSGNDSDSYIYPDVDDYLPPSVYQDDLDRDGADRVLRKFSKTGSYLLRNSSHPQARKVLSVWTDDRCRHYKVFHDKTTGFSLIKGHHFNELADLLQFYHGNSLPKSDFKLSRPYQGLLHS